MRRCVGSRERRRRQDRHRRTSRYRSVRLDLEQKRRHLTHHPRLQLLDYIYYHSSGTDSYRFSGGGLCTNTQVTDDVLEAAVWVEVRALLESPQRLDAEYTRRFAAPDMDPNLDSIKAQIAKVKANDFPFDRWFRRRPSRQG